MVFLLPWGDKSLNKKRTSFLQTCTALQNYGKRFYKKRVIPWKNRVRILYDGKMLEHYCTIVAENTASVWQSSSMRRYCCPYIEKRTTNILYKQTMLRWGCLKEGKKRVVSFSSCPSLSGFGDKMGEDATKISCRCMTEGRHGNKIVRNDANMLYYRTISPFLW